MRAQRLQKWVEVVFGVGSNKVPASAVNVVGADRRGGV